MDIIFLYKELDKRIEQCKKLEKECAEDKDYAGAAQYQAMADAYGRVRYNIIPVFERMSE